MPAQPEGFGAYLQRAMGKWRLRRIDLARAADVSPTAVTRWLKDQQQPQVEQLVKISGPLHIPLEELLVAAGHISPAGVRPVTPVATVVLATDEARIVAAETDAADPAIRAQIVSVVRALTGRET